MTDEASAPVKKFIGTNGVKYLIAIKGAAEYRTRGIPRAWLVGANGKVVWEGHPASLPKATIEEELKHVRLGPAIKLPPELKKADFYLSKQRYGDAVKELKRYAKRPKDPAVGAKATAAVEKVEAYGKSELELVEKKVTEGQFHVVLRKLTAMEKSFKGLEAGDTAKSRLKELKKDKELKIEMEIASYVVRAEAYMDAGGYRQAGGILKKVTKQKRFAEAKMREVAEVLLDEVLSKL